MQHLLSEARISLTALAHQHGVSPSTVWRWSMRGIRGHRLETYTMGGRRYTTSEAFVRFVASTQMESGSVLQPANDDGLGRAHQEAERFLESEGVQ